MSKENDPTTSVRRSTRTVIDAATADELSSQAVTLGVVDGKLEKTMENPEAKVSASQSFRDRYEPGVLLGEGGMGQVLVCRDEHIGRNVAMKVVRADRRKSVEIRARFLREVRIQGQLEHPSIVPVYDVGIGENGSAYFTMKRVKGATLEEIIARLAAGDPATHAEYSPRKLLVAFQSVCLAIDFAHSRSVVHRDLKPSNIMLGRFGEVYVLDWGIAKILKEDQDEQDDDLPPQSRVSDSSDLNATQAGAFFGTLGYVSPEQLAGGDIDGRSDIFSLGAILFELLTLQPLYPGSDAEILKTIGHAPDARCSVRAPALDIPPELEEICIETTELDPRLRPQTARELHDAIGSYLDGDRDLELRRKIAKKHLDSAIADVALAEGESADAEAHRARALGELGRAIALDPTNDEAMSKVVNLLLAPPRNVPAEVERELRTSQLASMGVVGRLGGFVFFAGFCLLLPTLLHVHAEHVTLAVLIGSSNLAAGILSFMQFKRPTPLKSYAIMIMCFACFLGISRLYGPFVCLPAIAIATSMTYGMHPSVPIQRTSLALMLASVGIPFFFEVTGVWPSSYAFEKGAMIILPRTLDIERGTTFALLAILTLFLIYAATAVIQRARNALTRAEETLLIQAWQFRQLAPERARTGARALKDTR